ncbi:SRPBCC family protein [Streptomyces rhizosphaerihabitans]|uniref:SRPBCC family protein n=1 Tax=Streptomyces rhizosphaerihabitans TaxID=1266770 RepID=UPI0021C1694C|nr:SRPBCC family protein [Streptomyces rhizosphaerihabitans]MCT9006806.1 SRPBCC family protein [Streptomyces rhizosphaerihabitans]
MATTTASIDIAASPDRVWQLIGGFDSLPDWLPYIPTSELSDGGRLRRLVNEEGDVIVERLEAFDNEARTYSYSILRAPFPVTGYRSTLSVHETSRQDTARVEWSGTFTPDGISDDDAITLFHGIYTQGLTALIHTLTPPPSSF